MAVPSITLFYLVLLAILYSALSLVVVAMRARTNTPFGDGGNRKLLCAIRSHGNFAEWVPMAVLLVGGLETLGSSATTIHVLMGALLAARVLHPLGLFSPVDSTPYMVGRITGALATWVVVTGAAVLLLVQLL